MTEQFERFSDELSRCDWYSLPTEMQRMYAFFLSDTQHPVKFSSYAGITCERETSKMVLTFGINLKIYAFQFIIFL